MKKSLNKYEFTISDILRVAFISRLRNDIAKSFKRDIIAGAMKHV